MTGWYLNAHQLCVYIVLCNITNRSVARNIFSGRNLKDKRLCLIPALNLSSNSFGGRVFPVRGPPVVYRTWRSAGEPGP